MKNEKFFWDEEKMIKKIRKIHDLIKRYEKNKSIYLKKKIDKQYEEIYPDMIGLQRQVVNTKFQYYQKKYNLIVSYKYEHELKEDILNLIMLNYYKFIHKIDFSRNSKMFSIFTSIQENITKYQVQIEVRKTNYMVSFNNMDLSEEKEEQMDIMSLQNKNDMETQRKSTQNIQKLFKKQILNIQENYLFGVKDNLLSSQDIINLNLQMTILTNIDDLYNIKRNYQDKQENFIKISHTILNNDKLTLDEKSILLQEVLQEMIEFLKLNKVVNQDDKLYIYKVTYRNVGNFYRLLQKEVLKLLEDGEDDEII